MRATADQDSQYKAFGYGSVADSVADAQVLVNYFNTQFELYGRHVVLKQFTGQGSWLAEASGQDQAGANADAQTAYDMGAFAQVDVSFGSYLEALASHRVIAMGFALPQSFYKRHAPYLYGNTQYASPESEAESLGALTCQQMGRKPAVYAGDPVYQKTTRTFGIVEPSTPEYVVATQVYAQRAKQCGITVRQYQYGDTSQASQVVAQMKADGTTTVMSVADPFMNVLMTQSAATQRYNPEWVFNSLQNSFGRDGDAGQMAHAMSLSTWQPYTQTPDKRLCPQIYKLASKGGSPRAVQLLELSCTNLLSVFAAVQQAGPSLTPTTFQGGWFSLPPSTTVGDYGGWGYGSGGYAPIQTFHLEWWNPSYQNPFDGKQGGFLYCNGGAQYYYSQPSMQAGQPRCFGR